MGCGNAPNKKASSSTESRSNIKTSNENNRVGLTVRIAIDTKGKSIKLSERNQYSKNDEPTIIMFENLGEEAITILIDNNGQMMFNVGEAVRYSLSTKQSHRIDIYTEKGTSRISINQKGGNGVFVMKDFEE